jgi:hypothetical protein
MLGFCWNLQNVKLEFSNVVLAKPYALKTVISAEGRNKGVKYALCQSIPAGGQEGKWGVNK